MWTPDADEQATGTHDDDTRDDAEEETGAGASGEVDAGGSDPEDADDEQDELARTKAELEHERNARKQLLSEKSTWERRQASEGAQPKSPTGEGDNDEAKRRRDWDRDVALAEKLTDKNAKWADDEEAAEAIRASTRIQLANMRYNMAQAQERDLERGLSKAEKAEDRAEAEKLIRSGEFRSTERAIEHVQMKRRLAELEAAGKKKDPKDEEAENKAVIARSAPQVGSRGLGSGETSRRVRESAFYERLSSFPATPAGFAEKNAYHAKYKDRLIPD